MKIAVLLILISIIPFCSYSKDPLPKDKYAIGKVFKKNNDTLDVYIKIDSFYNMQLGIQYVDSMGLEHQLLPSKAKGFSLIYQNETMVFEARHDLTKVVFQPRFPDYFFINRISTGRFSLYFFIEKKLVMEGIDQVEAEKSRYLVLYNDDWYPISKDYFRGDCSKIFTFLKREGFITESKKLSKELNSDGFKYETTPALIERINQLIPKED